MANNDDFGKGGSPWGSPGGGNGSGRKGPTPPNIDEVIKKNSRFNKKICTQQWFQQKTYNFRFSYCSCDLGI